MLYFGLPGVGVGRGAGGREGRESVASIIM